MAEYSLWDRSAPLASICELCGAVVALEDQHNDWHARQETDPMSDHDPALIEKAEKALAEAFGCGIPAERCEWCPAAARAVLDAVADDLRAGALREAAGVMSERLDHFPAEGRHTRARWAEQWLRDRAARIDGKGADRG